MVFRKLVVQLSNCAPRKLNVFLKTLQAKLEIMLSQGPKVGLKGCHTPVTMSKLVPTISLAENSHKVIVLSKISSMMEQSLTTGSCNKNLLLVGSGP